MKPIPIKIEIRYVVGGSVTAADIMYLGNFFMLVLFTLKGSINSESSDESILYPVYICEHVIVLI